MFTAVEMSLLFIISFHSLGFAILVAFLLPMCCTTQCKEHFWGPCGHRIEASWSPKCKVCNGLHSQYPGQSYPTKQH